VKSNIQSNCDKDGQMMAIDDQKQMLQLHLVATDRNAQKIISTMTLMIVITNR